MSPARVQAAIAAEWSRLRDAASAASLYLTLDDALALEMQIERDHRRFMRGKGSYSCGVETAAKYHVVRQVASELRLPRTWTDFVTFRKDVPVCQAIRETLPPEVRRTIGSSADFKAIDYAGDIAK